ncbi:MAG: ribbon-helix-helix protein, CopG family [Actinomycetota bacterium]
MTYRDTLFYMAEAISVRLDQDSVRALRKLQATGLSQSEAIRRAIIESAHVLRNPQRLTAEIAALEADEGDRDEMLRVAELMESLRG